MKRRALEGRAMKSKQKDRRILRGEKMNAAMPGQGSGIS
jgi:hypothetical protein